VRVERCAGVEELLVRGGEFLIAREAEHNLILGLCAGLQRDPRGFQGDPYLAVVVDESRVVAVAVRTPPYGLVLSEIDDLGAVDLLAADVRKVCSDLPGVLGPSRAAVRFVAVWETSSGARARHVRAQRIYRAESAIVPAGVPGELRAYTVADRDLAVAWIEAFVEEALSDLDVREPGETLLDRRLGDPEGGIVFWADPELVSLAGFGGPTPHGIRVGLVYTPPELRGRGYASALVAELTRNLLEGGRRHCFLFTDLANPTSNTIYQRVGYEPIADVDQWALG
jgi:predicted GNAT family acetyltransferase